MNKTMRALLLTGGLIGPLNTALAAENMTFRGTLLAPPPCRINDSNQLDVDFGQRVGINKVDGVNYRQVLNYQIACDRATNGNWALTLSLKGGVSGFDKQALATNKSDLGIRIYRDDEPFTPGSTLNITLDNPPQLEAVPVQKQGVTLSEGAFEAWATLQADYQ
ncbi:TPA: fimbrial protein [Serratia marcescens]|uniref:fimbrial protein n=1 Tax=Serratia TaxID=613 RepID=UPI00080BE934|nr:fimbrial protein [Serratia marcescens]MBH3205820.1 fimbrial protein [Serratia marcescens]HAT2868627.1 fimbrial protein [Serratia marcescens]HAT2873859.1 fimbrial protein [Serratia marcescens]HAT2924513.1 fimbrial protein [Serratia marcescens]